MEEASTARLKASISFASFMWASFRADDAHPFHFFNSAANSCRAEGGTRDARQNEATVLDSGAMGKLGKLE
jgi:hypothetical protein